MKTVLVSGSDAGLFPLLQGLVRSIRDHAEGRPFALGVMDAGLEPEQREWIEEHADLLVRPGWDLREPKDEPSYLKCFDSRMLLPRYFPGFDTYMWIDADAWVQDGSVLDLYVRAAGTGALGIVAEVHPALPELSPALRARYSLLRGARLDSWAHRKYRQAYGKSTMRELGLRPVMNAGVFALHREAPHWAAWEESYRLALARRSDIWVNQISLNHAVYRKDLPVQLLPLRCNWPCSAAMPSYDSDRGMYVEPYLPHDPLGIVHMTWDTKYGSFDLATPDGGHVRRGLGYPRRPAEPARGR